MDERARVTRARRRRARRRGGSPLPRRRTDRVEDLVAWLLTSLGLLAVLGSVLVGQAAHQAALGRATAATPVRAELLTDTPPRREVGQRIPPPRTHAPVTWTDRHGVRHVGTVAVPPARTAGSPVTLWVDGTGQIVADPAERSAEAAAFGISAGLTVVALSWALLTLVWSVVCRMTAACNAAGWAREWALVEPLWRRSPS
jgi:hypothetical protein